LASGALIGGTCPRPPIATALRGRKLDLQRTPRLSGAATESHALGLLSATILLEQVLGAAILLDVSLFGLMDPAG
jgi:hypothetical protein